MGARAIKFAIIVMIASCFSRAANQRYEARVADIDQEFERETQEVFDAYASATKQVHELRAYLVKVQPDARAVPVELVRDRPELVAMLEQCTHLQAQADALVAQGGSTGIAASVNEKCTASYWQAYAQALGRTYWAADIDWVVAQMKSGTNDTDVEQLFVYSHNLRLEAFIDEQLRVAREHRDEALAILDEQKQLAKRAAEEEREQEIADARRRFGNALAVMGQALSHSPQRQPTYSPYAASAAGGSGCTSDFACGIGYTCVKANYAAQGVCAKNVNGYGNQTFDLPRMDSVFVKMPSNADCHFSTDCPIGFRCDTRSGACLR